MDRIFKTPFFNRWMKKVGLEDLILGEAIDELSSDFIELREVDLDYAVAEKKLMEVPYDTKR